ncbi:MAG: hypothetical protein KZQ65_12680, partial [Candidatus Thiodiazotropha sp. (ex Gloverina cf. vestifex)]|nr:hypothetical protein [Candidatus Thiodiazotropha sp. (ex Gloverina cf. vestifex)]
RMRSLYALHRSLTVTITAIQPRLRLSGTNRLGFQPSMAISVCNFPWLHISNSACALLVS